MLNRTLSGISPVIAISNGSARRRPVTSSPRPFDDKGLLFRDRRLLPAGNGRLPDRPEEEDECRLLSHPEPWPELVPELDSDDLRTRFLILKLTFSIRNRARNRNAQ